MARYNVHDMPTPAQMPNTTFTADLGDRPKMRDGSAKGNMGEKKDGAKSKTRPEGKATDTVQGYRQQVKTLEKASAMY